MKPFIRYVGMGFCSRSKSLGKNDKILNKIEKDCLQLKKQKALTMYGFGQLHLIKIIRGER